jgi:hypothetical protein
MRNHPQAAAGMALRCDAHVLHVVMQNASSFFGAGLKWKAADANGQVLFEITGE